MVALLGGRIMSMEHGGFLCVYVVHRDLSVPLSGLLLCTLHFSARTAAATCGGLQQFAAPCFFGIGGMSRFQGMVPYGDVTTAEIPLDEELLGSFCRRGRRRLRELQDATQTIVRLDRARQCLSVTGTQRWPQLSF